MRSFKQRNGTAIGTKFAPSYTILFMGYLEDKILNSLVEKPLVWWCYIDDSCHPTIKFTAEYSLDKVNFLDVDVIRSGNKLLTDLYIRSTATHQYLEVSSCHVYHSKKSIPYSQVPRFKRIC